MDTPDAEVSSSSLPSSLYRVSPASRELPAVGTAVNEAGMGSKPLHRRKTFTHASGWIAYPSLDRLVLASAAEIWCHRCFSHLS